MGRGAEQRAGRRAQQRRNTFALLPPVVDAEIARIAAEELIAAVAGQGHRDMLARHARHQRGRDLRRIGERLVVHVGQAGHDRQRIFRGDVKLGMVGAQVRRNRLGVLRLVVALFMEADGESAHRLRTLGLHQRDDGGRIDAARQEGAQGHVR